MFLGGNPLGYNRESESNWNGMKCRVTGCLRGMHLGKSLEIHSSDG